MLFPVTVSMRRPRLQLHTSDAPRRHHSLMIVIAIAIAVIALLLPRTGHVVAAGVISAVQTPATPDACPAGLNFRVKYLQDDAPQDFCQYAGRVMLVVNITSYCGYTHRYEGFEALYAKYRDKGLMVLDFPSNNFQQEPGNSKQIVDFYYNMYGVKFPIFSKTAVVGAGASPLYARLATQTGQPPRWNFRKYLLDRTGRMAAVFPNSVELSDPAFIKRIDALLAEPLIRSFR